MAIKARIEFIDRSIVFRPGGGLSPKEISAKFAAFAGEQIALIDKQNAQTAGSEVPHETFVDGVQTANLSQVKPNGVIIAQWELTNDVLQWIWDAVRIRAPVGGGRDPHPGRFRDSQRIYADGVEVESPADAAGASEVVIASTVPYARKIEGLGRKEPLSPKAPDGVYQAVAALAAAKFGNIAKIRFTTREIVGGGTQLEQWAIGHAAKALSERKRQKQHAKDVRQPAIVIYFK